MLGLSLSCKPSKGVVWDPSKISSFVTRVKFDATNVYTLGARAYESASTEGHGDGNSAAEHNLGTGDFIIDLFLNPATSPTAYEMLCGKYQTNTIKWYLGLTADDEPNFYARDNGGNLIQLTTTATITVGEWQHLSVVVDRNNSANCKFYLNGVALTTNVLDLEPDTIDNTGFFKVAELNSGNYFNGSLSRLRICKPTDVSALDIPTLIASLYNLGNGKFYSELSSSELTDLAISAAYDCKEDGVTVTDLLDATSAGNDLTAVGTISVDDGSSVSVASDESGQGNHGQLTHADAITAYSSNIPSGVANVADGLSMFFDGTDDLVSIGDVGAGDLLTIAFWMKPTDQSTYQEIFIDGDNFASNTCSFCVGIWNNDTIFFRTRENGTFTGNSSGTVTYGSWQHVLVAYNATTEKVSFFINGVASGTDTLTGAGNLGSSFATRIGSGLDVSYPYLGLLDDIRAYNAEFTVTEAAQLNSGTDPDDTNLIGHWTMDDGGSSPVADGDLIGALRTAEGYRAVQATANLRPTFNASDSDFNNKPTITLAYLQVLEFFDALATDLDTSEGLVYVVGKAITPDAWEQWLSISDGSEPTKWLSFSPLLTGEHGIWNRPVVNRIIADASDTNAHIHGFGSNDTAYKIFIDAVDKSLTAAQGADNGSWVTELSATPDTVTIGGVRFSDAIWSAYHLKCTIAEIGFISAYPSASELTQLWNYLFQIWNNLSMTRLKHAVTPYRYSLALVTSQVACKNWAYNALKNGVDGTLLDGAFGSCTLNGGNGWWLWNLRIHKDHLDTIAKAIIAKSDDWPRTEYIFARYPRYPATHIWRKLKLFVAGAKYSNKNWQTRSDARITTFDSKITPQQIINMFANVANMDPPVTLVIGE